MCFPAVRGHPRVFEEHASGDGHSRDLPQHRLQDRILRPVGNNLGANCLFPASPEGGALQTDCHTRYHAVTRQPVNLSFYCHQEFDDSFISDPAPGPAAEPVQSAASAGRPTSPQVSPPPVQPSSPGLVNSTEAQSSSRPASPLEPPAVGADGKTTEAFLSYSTCISSAWWDLIQGDCKTQLKLQMFIGFTADGGETLNKVQMTVCVSWRLMLIPDCCPLTAVKDSFSGNI